MMRLLLAFLLLSATLIGPRPALASSAPTFAAAPLLAEYEWDWDGFRRYWKRQMQKSSGVAGIVILVVGAGLVVVMSTKRKD